MPDRSVQQQILDLLAARREMTFAELRQATGREAPRLVRALAALAAAGDIQVDGAPWTRERLYRRLKPQEHG
jgi:DNA-binding IclR family transcriptional regulator